MNMDGLNPNLTKVQAVVEWVNQRVQWQVYSPHSKLPSIRALAKRLGVSGFTIGQAYDQLVALGILTAKTGSGFYVNPPIGAIQTLPTQAMTDNVIDTRWLMNHMFAGMPADKAPASGTLPKTWLAYPRLETLLRQVVSKANDFAYDYGDIQGYFPLREQFCRQADGLGIAISPRQVITTGGVSTAVDMVARALLQTGDAVAVDDPSWFWLSSCLQNQGLRVFGVKRDEQGPDIEQLRQLMKNEKIKLYLTNSVLHNPTSYCLHPARAHQVLNLLHEFNAYLVEDDLYSAFDEGGQALRYATLDQLERVFYISGTSKVIGSSWRVGLLACPQPFIEPILRVKMLSNMTTPEFCERVIYQICLDTDYRRHTKKLRTRLYQAHIRLKETLPKIGIQYPKHAHLGGLFLWIDTGVDTAQMALDAYQNQWLIASGQLFSPHKNRSSFMRINVARTSDAFLDWLGDYLHDQNRY